MQKYNLFILLVIFTAYNISAMQNSQQIEASNDKAQTSKPAKISEEEWKKIKQIIDELDRITLDNPRLEQPIFVCPFTNKEMSGTELEHIETELNDSSINEKLAALISQQEAKAIWEKHKDFFD